MKKLKNIFNLIISVLAIMTIRTIFVNDAHEIVSEEGWKKLAELENSKKK